MRNKIVLIVLIVLIPVATMILAPRSRQWPLFYMASFNLDTRLYTIGQYAVGEKQATPIFALHDSVSPASTLFSAQELSDLRRYRADGDVPSTAKWGEQFPPIRGISQIWRFDATHLLVLTTNDIRDPLGRGGDTNEHGRFGYHEFSLLDLNNPQALQPLFRIDYHDRAYEQWGDCGTAFVYPQEVTLNPTQSKIAFMLEPAQFYCTSPYLTTLIVADYFTSPVQFNRIPLAAYPVWSPDGTQLAYLQAKNIGDPTKVGFQYNLSVTIQRIDTGQVTTIETLSGFSFDVGLNSPVWVDDQTLIYRWFPLSIVQGGDPAPIYKQYLLRQHELTKINIYPEIGYRQNYLANIFPIRDRSIAPRYLLGTTGYYSDDRLNAFVLSGQAPLAIYKRWQVEGVPLYNSRFPDRILFVRLKQDSTLITALDVDFSIISIDLSKVLPPREFVSWSIAS